MSVDKEERIYITVPFSLDNLDMKRLVKCQITEYCGRVQSVCMAEVCICFL